MVVPKQSVLISRQIEAEHRTYKILQFDMDSILPEYQKGTEEEELWEGIDRCVQLKN